MRRPLLLTACVGLYSAAALADANIPTKYEGRFPAVRRNITGTFAGKSLTLRYGRVAGKRAARRSGNYSCPGMWFGH